MFAQSSARSGEEKATPQFKAFLTCPFIRFSHGLIWNLNRPLIVLQQRLSQMGVAWLPARNKPASGLQFVAHRALHV
ncbi:hypothetical protein GCM10007094_19370 [Pseudovibrio japonicus]|uniref:Uncharacterized protein n=1 Tax=Pseudovibrio japonicus TaxID=366534 RepID=A0ABQ3EBE8_9HYPH|nr:hypothetical protein GCM10007094_19370 [Pseudovibrio japonicus]